MPIGIKNNDGAKDPFEEFLDQLNVPREVMQETVPVIEPEPEPLTTPTASGGGDIEDIDPVYEKKKLDIAMIPAETIVDVIDTTAISVNSYIAHEHIDGASPEEKESLQKAIANYLRETDVDISPGKMCIILIMMIYGPKVLQAFQTRKINEENEALKARVAELEDQLNQPKEVKNGTVPSV